MKRANENDSDASELKQRILHLADILGITRKQLVNQLGVVSSVLSGENLKAWPNSSLLVRIMNEWPEVSSDWLLLGRGNPLRDMPDTSVCDERSRPKPIESDDELQMKVGFDKMLDKVEEQAKKIALLEYQLEYYKNKEEGGSTSGTRPGKKVHPATPGM